MAQPTVLAGTKLIILVGNEASPEVYSEPCGLTTRSFEMAASTNSTLIPDCAAPDAPAWEAKDVNALSATISGAGVMAIESFTVWNNWFLSGLSKTCHVKLDHSSLGYWLGNFILTSLKYGGERGQKVTIDVTMVNDGAVTWVPA